MRARVRRLIGVVALVCALCAATGTVAQAGPPPPRNVVPPLVIGVPLTGQTLSKYNGIWTLGGTPYVFTQLWLRCGLTGGSCVSTGATTPTYVVSAADVG